MKKASDHNEYELPDEYDFADKPARRGRSGWTPTWCQAVGYQSLINAALRARLNSPPSTR